MRWIWRALTRRLLLKFTALLCAVVLWVYVDFTVRAEARRSCEAVEGAADTVIERVLDVAFNIPPKAVGPLQVRQLDGRELPVNNVWVQATVRGPARAVRSLRENVDVRATFGIPGGLRKGPVSLPINEENIIVPQGRGLEVVAVNPRQIEFLLVPAGAPATTEHQ